jgi:hypothetical protein
VSDTVVREVGNQLHALWKSNAKKIARWLMVLENLQSGCKWQL